MSALQRKRATVDTLYRRWQKAITNDANDQELHARDFAVAFSEYWPEFSAAIAAIEDE